MATRKKKPQEEVRPVPQEEAAPIPKATDTRTATPIPAVPPFPEALSGKPPIAGYNPTPAPEAPLAPLAPTRPVAPPAQREPNVDYSKEMALYDFRNLAPSSQSIVSQAQGNTQGVVGQGPRSPLFSLQPQTFSDLRYQSQAGENSQFRNIGPSGDILNRDLISPVPRSYTPKGNSIFSGDASKTPQPYAPLDNKPFSLSETGYQRAGATGFMSPIVADNRFVPNQGGFLPSSQATAPATTVTKSAKFKVDLPNGGSAWVTKEGWDNFNAATARRQQEQAKEAARAQAFEAGMERATRIGQANAKARQDESIRKHNQFIEDQARKEYIDSKMAAERSQSMGHSGRSQITEAINALGRAEEFKLRGQGGDAWKKAQRNDGTFVTDKGVFRRGSMGRYEAVELSDELTPQVSKGEKRTAARRGYDAPSRESESSAMTSFGLPIDLTETPIVPSGFGLFNTPWGSSIYGNSPQFLQ